MVNERHIGNNLIVASYVVTQVTFAVIEKDIIDALINANSKKKEKNLNNNSSIQQIDYYTEILSINESTFKKSTKSSNDTVVSGKHFIFIFLLLRTFQLKI